MTKKNVKILCIVLSIILLVIVVLQISHTYSVFYSELKGSSEIKIGKWDILVNNEQVTGGYTTNFTMNELDFSESPNVLEGKIAPGMFGSGQISIKPNNVDVSIRYDITLNDEVIVNEKISISDLTILNSTKTLIKTAERTYTGTILLQDMVANYEDIIGLNVIWENDENNNNKDTELGINPVTGIGLPISIKFSQYLGEAINAI